MGTTQQVIIRAFARIRRLTIQVQSDPEGTLWRDPPHYWEQIVYPAYERAHCGLFEGGNVEHGKPTDEVAGLLLFEGARTDLDFMVTSVVEKVMEVTEASQ